MKRLTENVDGSNFNAILAGRVDLFPPFPDYVDVVEVTTSNTTYTIPTGARFLIVASEPGVNYAMKQNGAATYPAAGVSDGTGSFINPTIFDVDGITSLGVIGKTGTIYLSIGVYT